ncbi:MAG: hypothetical protein LUC41_08980 [Clostridiales bacterium]|nr:hypothetical protein [Clostridiales bacterium]
MSVGTESIRRVSAKASEAEAPENPEVEVGEKMEAENPAAKSGEAKEASVKTSVIPSVTPEVAEEMGIKGNEAYYLNDELPVYLL